MKKTITAIMDYSIEYVDDYWSDLIQDTDFDVFSGEYLNKKQNNKLNCLVNVDYSLNSPLIPDETEELIKYLLSRPYRNSWTLPKWSNFKAGLKHYNVPLNSIRQPSTFHQWWGKFNRLNPRDTSVISKQLDSAQRDSDLTFPIIRSFLKGWIGKNVNNPTKSNVNKDTLKWGQYSYELHVVTLILNSVNQEERIAIAQEFTEFNISESGVGHNSSFNSKNLGKIIISDGLIYLLNHGYILDRNMLLMMKDTYLARFHTLLSMQNRVDNHFPPNSCLTMSKLYTLGDKCLDHGGNDSYSALKLIEPLCNLRLSELAHEYRPKIPQDPNFRDHLVRMGEELSANLPPMRELIRLINTQHHVETVLTMYGSFRHWGHPFLDCLEGLRALYDQVTMEKIIDFNFASELASDLAYIVLRDKFDKDRTWYVDASLLDDDHVFKKHIVDKTWPTPKQILDFGPNWHILPLVQCFDIPDMIDPSTIYSDKSHSMDLGEVKNHILSKSEKPIPSRKVMESYLHRKQTNWPEFLRSINDQGLDKEKLLIGLKGKERELKIKGRFFALMSWELREYFVITEYLIKKHFVPLFKGLTMADNSTVLTKKLMDNTYGQGTDNYDHVSFANHVDYEKWNNHQRGAANNPTFKVMGQFLGYPNLISRTHEFFEQSLIYYNQRPDLMEIIDGQIVNKRGHRVCWSGQSGGLEGLRQKGWSITNLLIIRRASIRRNTRVQILAQGDNQVICTQYSLHKTRNDQELQQCLNDISRNNDDIMREIEEGTRKLGLIINRDETMRSADFLSYGKVPVFRGNIRGLETKRWSRVTCVSNDQLPGLGNILSTVSSNALTVSHYSESPINSMIHYNFLGNFVTNLLDRHNPAIKMSTQRSVKHSQFLKTFTFRAGLLYLDPSLGGITGMSPGRFLMRMFPDPVSEALSSWKVIYNNIDPKLKMSVLNIITPKLGKVSASSFSKLLEDPLSLNIPTGIKALTLIKKEVKKSLISNVHKIKNEIVKDALIYSRTEEPRFLNFLRSVKPLFPRFLSEYKSATYLGITESLIGLFENSKTIRNVCSKKMSLEVDKITVRSEIVGIVNLVNKARVKGSHHKIWNCSSSMADELRLRSWGSPVVGATVPHPLELISKFHEYKGRCKLCALPGESGAYISVLIPAGLYNYWESRGPYQAYLGSKTSETTSLLTPWEKEAVIPLIERASRLRNAINWFVEPDSNLARCIKQNLDSLTGEDSGETDTSFRRTGSAPHRFSCSRQSSGGFSGQSPVKLTRMCATTDTLSEYNQRNYDFMYQSLLIYSQITAGEIHDGKIGQGFYHFHTSCQRCIRESYDITLESPGIFQHIDVSQKLIAWKPQNSMWFKEKRMLRLNPCLWDRLSVFDKSFHVGRAQGFLYGMLSYKKNQNANDSSLFPVVMRNKVLPAPYMIGLLDGLSRAGALACLSRRSVSELTKPRPTILGTVLHLIEKISQNPGLVNTWRGNNFQMEFSTVPHKTPSSYPLNNIDLGSLGRNYLKFMYLRHFLRSEDAYSAHPDLIVFSETSAPDMVQSLALSGQLTNLLYKKGLDKSHKDALRSIKVILHQIQDQSDLSQDLSWFHGRMTILDREVRHACGDIIVESSQLEEMLKSRHKWGAEEHGTVLALELEKMTTRDTEEPPPVEIPRVQDPLISGLRLFQCATGSHYKVRSLLRHFKIQYRDAISGGDGSGGIGSMLLRYNPSCRIIFNSLLNLEGVTLRGCGPSPPSAISSLIHIKDRCVNLNHAWMEPNDLSQVDTWETFKINIKKYKMNIDLIILDMEIVNQTVMDKIEDCVSSYISEILSVDGCLIFKTYLDRILNNKSNIVSKVGLLFEDVFVCTTQLSSSFTSEVYIVFRRLSTGNIFLHPSLNEVRSRLSEFPVCRSPEQEFERALSVIKMDLLKGVPKIMITDPFIELSTFLVSLGVETGIAALLGESITKPALTNTAEMPVLVFMVGVASLLKLNSGSKVKNSSTDRLTRSTGIMLIVFAMWYAVQTNDINLYKRAKRHIDTSFTLSWRFRMIKDNWFSFVSVQSLTNIHRSLHLDSDLAAIGQGIRIYTKVFRDFKKLEDVKKLNEMLMVINKGWSIKGLKNSTDIFQYVWGDLCSTSGDPKPSGKWSQVDVQDSGAYLD
ncbi:L protein [Gata virus]|uniref:Replicase n=1 Tax=Gata virus TaxID=1911435 RepID=A0A2Z2CF64_9RHAB|nr:L protein [Gata virus]AOX47527.1 L protein [Gata virus]